MKRESRERRAAAGPDRELRQLLDQLNEGAYVTDSGRRILFWNRAAERITGVKRKEALGRSCCEVFRASICEASCALRETLATGRPIANRPIYILGVKGQRIPISISTAVFKDRRGNVIGGVETFRDLSLVEDLRKELEGKHRFGDIVGRSAAMRQVFQLLPLLADSESTVLIQGVRELYGAPVTVTDLRAGAALVVAGLMAKGVTEIYETSYIDRGYERIEEKLRSLGAEIRREKL